MMLAPGESREFRFRLYAEEESPPAPFGAAFDQTFSTRISETDSFYDLVLKGTPSEQSREVSLQAYAGLIWTKQFYWYAVAEWLEGDPSQPRPAPQRAQGRNADWSQLYNRDVLSMPDNWEYPWYAAWDLAFHTVAFARIDPDFAKSQLILLLR